MSELKSIAVVIHELHPLAYIGLLLIFGYIGGEIANSFKIPRVTGYLVMGMLLSHSVLGLFHERLVKEELTVITHIALGIIAFSIGGSLSLSNLKKLGRYIVWINVTEASGAFIFVTGILMLFFLFDGGTNQVIVIVITVKFRCILRVSFFIFY